jgi:hypothetical protein
VCGVPQPVLYYTTQYVVIVCEPGALGSVLLVCAGYTRVLPAAYVVSNTTQE